ncbi:eukaryotic translation initiation factor 3 subunit C [Trichonephila clavata]|uniref:Eukaryotic translation initiation factor 3 subunit C n=1 Tax=Trichonephila clavata TaxID=2740835 RepID=A0A8X6LGS0_TRICU|nr:eukaryotic translation initiation factor 3 subunit C [Trichonephila clavata]
MDEEFTKMLQGCDAHSPEYTEYTIELCRIYLRCIEHLYYKFDSRMFEVKQENTPVLNGVGVITGQEPPEKDEKEEISADIITMLCKFICAKDTTDRIRTQATLFRIYHLALHDRWFQARDLMLMSHLQLTIEHSDVSTMIIYNRALVQLGLCAFRHGYIKDAHAALLDIQSGDEQRSYLHRDFYLNDNMNELQIKRK